MKAKDNPNYNQTRQQLLKNNDPQIAKAAQLDAAHQASKKPIAPSMTTLKDAKRLSYRPGASAGENWSKS